MTMLENATSAFTNALSSMIYTPVAEDGDYHEGGLLFCGKCRTCRQMEIDLLGDGVLRKVPVMCDCENAAFERQREIDREREKAARIKHIRQMGLGQTSWQNAGFDADDKRDAEASKLCSRYAQGFRQMLEGNMGLMLYGGVGTGKTFLAACIANALIDQGYRVVMDSLPSLIGEMGLGEERAEEMIRLMRCDLLILDDVGVERDTTYGIEQAYEVINARYKSGKPLVVTTNLTPQQMTADTGPRKRAFDRIVEMCRPVMVQGESRRMGIAHQKRKAAEDYLEVEG